MYCEIKQIMSCYSHSIGRWITGRFALQLRLRLKNTKIGTRVTASSIFGVQYYFRYVGDVRMHVYGVDWTRFTPMIPDQLSIPRTQRRPGYKYRSFFFPSCNSISLVRTRALLAPINSIQTFNYCSTGIFNFYAGISGLNVDAVSFTTHPSS